MKVKEIAELLDNGEFAEAFLEVERKVYKISRTMKAPEYKTARKKELLNTMKNIREKLKTFLDKQCPEKELAMNESRELQYTMFSLGEASMLEEDQNERD